MRVKPRHLTYTAIVGACIFPVLLLLFLSLSRNWIFPALLPQQFSMGNWVDAFATGSGIRQSLLLTLCLSLGVAALSTVGGFLCSKLIAYHKRRNTLLLLAYLPFVLSPVIFAVCLRFFFIKMNLAGTFGGVLLAHLIIAFPFAVIFFTGFWNRQIKLYEMVVQTLGGSARHAFRAVIVPAARPMLLVCFFQCFLIAWFEYGLTSVIGYGKVQTLTIKVYQFLTEANLFFAALSSCLLVMPPVLLLLINKRILFSAEK